MASNTYDASAITVMEGLEAVRKRPGMYIGGTGRAGLHHLLWELVDNAVDEAMNGFASHIQVILHKDGRTATVVDNGRGIPVDIHPKHKRSALELILTSLHSGAKFEQGAYITSGGLHGVGASVVNALSSNLAVSVRRDGGEWRQEYRRGKPRGDVRRVGDARGSGTRVQFTPDEQIFGERAFDPDKVREQLDIKAFLNPGLRIVLRDEARSVTTELEHSGGLKDYLDHLLKKAKQRSILGEPFTMERIDNGAVNGGGFRLPVKTDLALLWTESPKEQVLSFVNGIPTQDGGTHEQGIKEAVVKAVRNYAETHDKLPRNLKISADDIREGLVVVISLFLVEPQFQGQTKDKLNNPEVRGQIDSILRPALVGGKYAIGNKKGRCPAVICNDLHGHLNLPGSGFLLARESFNGLHDGHKQIGVIIGGHILKHRHNTFQAKPCINTGFGKGGHGTGLIPFKLHEHQIPQFKVAIALTSHSAIGIITSKGLSPVNVDLTTGTAGAGIPHGPEIILCSQTDNTIFGDTNVVPPQVIGFIIVQINRDPEL